MPHTETWIDGIWHPSVTTILGSEEKPWLKAWREKWGSLAERKLGISNAIGTEVHRCIEAWLDRGTYTVSIPVYQERKLMPSLVPRIEGMLASWVKWANSTEGKIDFTELKVYSKLHAYSGTVDAVGTIDKQTFVIDWKTSSRIYDDMALQLVAYKEAYNEMRKNANWDIFLPIRLGYSSPIKNGLIVHISKGKPDFKVTTKEFKLGKRVFNKFLRLRANFDDIKTLPKEEGQKSAETPVS